ncbi:MAG: hypothetical protein JNL60_19360 [Bacteroidia bacterium]|nr:hypothetical protein [Bacteroidia bacterium]
MSNQFTYEIDERKLRMQLKDMEYPLSENSWQKFENYAASHVVHRASSATGAFRLNLNRNVVLPVVFGAVVISFSLLLLNFVSLKPAHKHEEQKAEVFKPAVTSPAPVKKETAKVQTAVQAAQPEIKTENTSVAVNSITPESNHSAGMAGDKLESTVVKATEIAQSVPSEAPAQIVNENIQAQTASNTEAEVAVKKKRKKNLDPAAQLQEEIRPTIVSDTQEEEVRPN